MSIKLVAQDMLNHRGRKREVERKKTRQKSECSSCVFLCSGLDTIHYHWWLCGWCGGSSVALACVLLCTRFSRWSAGMVGLSACGLAASRKPDQIFQSIMISGLWEDENEAFLKIAGYHFHENHRAGPDSRCGEIDSPFWWKDQQTFSPERASVRSWLKKS